MTPCAKKQLPVAHRSLAALRLSQAPWTEDELGEIVAQMHPHNSHQASIWQNAGEEVIDRAAFTLGDKQYTFSCIPQGRAPALLHMPVWAKCLNDVCRGQRKEIALCGGIWGTTATEEVPERCSWVLKLIEQKGFNVNLNMAQLKEPQVKCMDSETGETRRWINARKVKLSVK